MMRRLFWRIFAAFWLATVVVLLAFAWIATSNFETEKIPRLGITRLQRLELVVSDIEAAREDLISRGVEVGEPFHVDGGRVPGVDPQRRSYLSYATFSDPDGNGWLLQEVTTRLPGREWED